MDQMDGMDESSDEELPELGEARGEPASDGQGNLDEQPVPDNPTVKPPALELLVPRSYQQEMLKESLPRNIIIAMDTGSALVKLSLQS